MRSTWRAGRIATLKRSFGASSLPAVFAVLVICAAGFYADRQDNALFRQSQRDQVLDRIGLVRAKLEGNLKADVHLVQGLVATLMTEPQMDQQRFAALSSNLLENNSEITEIAAAPGLTIRLIYPLAGNEKALGLDYLNVPQQRDSVLKARDSRQTVLVGPVKLVQGGAAFVARIPVFTGDPETFWGIVSVVIDVNELYADSGLTEAAADLDIQLAGGNSATPSRKVNDPVVVPVTVPSAAWLLSASPKAGWADTSPNAWWVRLLMLAGGGVVLLPLLLARRFARERERHAQELRRRENELEHLSQRLDLALDASKVGVWDFDILHDVLVWDNRMNELYGLPTDGGGRSYQNWRAALHPEDLERAVGDFATAAHVSGHYRSQYRIVTPAGETRTVRAIGAVYGDGTVERKMVGVNWDVTADAALNDELTKAKTLTEARNIELEVAKARIEHIALHDALTGLPNRRYLDDILGRASSAQDSGFPDMALLHVDLDRFKEINDTLGHAAGDAMLVHAAKVLTANVALSDFVARIGGDEFVVLSLSGASTQQLEQLAERIIAEMRRPITYQGVECRCGFSVGIARQGVDNPDPKHLLVEADVALYQAKSRGRNRFEFFDDELRVRIAERKSLADDILRGVERGEFLPFYQPQFDARSLDVVGAEALVRWQHPVRGLLAPDAFLDIAEDLNVMASIDRLVLEHGLRDMDAWTAQGIRMPRLSVNVSARRLRDEGLIGSLRDLAITPGRVSFELVESIYLDESDSAIAWNIDHIKELGIDIEIDDFGTGYASIVSLTKLAPKRLKIDRQLTAPVTTSSAQRRLIAAIVEIGKALGIEVVAEGVETMGQATLLRDLGCDILQGYVLARPMPAAALGGFLAGQPWRLAS